MFKLLRTLSAAILCLLIHASCQKEYSEATVGTGGSTSVSGVFKAKIDGVQYTADASATAAILLGVTTISASSKDKKFFTIALTDTVSGTYVLDQNSFHGLAFLDSTDTDKEAFSTDGGMDTTQAGGKITITIDRTKKIVSGTFSCKVYRNSDGKRKMITEGSFQLPYLSAIPGAKSTDTFRVNIDGSAWSAKSISTAASGGFLTVVASEQNLTKIVTIQLPQTVTAGTYDIDLAGNYVGLYLPDGISPYVADTGKITVLERNTASKRIRANFNFTATGFSGGTNSAVLTNGYFSVGY